MEWNKHTDCMAKNKIVSCEYYYSRDKSTGGRRSTGRPWKHWYDNIPKPEAKKRWETGILPLSQTEEEEKVSGLRIWYVCIIC